MAIAPLQPHKSWYRRFWYADHSPLETLVDRALIFVIVALALVAGAGLLARHATDAPAGTRAPFIEVTR